MLNKLRNSVKVYLNSIYEVARRDRHKFEIDCMTWNPDALLLDCGCGIGDMTLIIANAIGTKKIIGLDYTNSVLRQAVSRGITPVLNDFNCFFPLCNDSVDIVYASNVIEHLIQPVTFVSEIYRVLKPGGYLVLDTPNLASWHNVFALILGVQPFSGPHITNIFDADISLVREMHYQDYGLVDGNEIVFKDEQEVVRHIVVMAYWSLYKLFIDQGFQISRKHGFGYYPFPSFLARILERIDIAHAHHMTFKVVKPK